MKSKVIIIGLVLVMLYLVAAIYYLPVTGIVWDETRYVSSAKARAYSIYSAATGSPGLEMCLLDAVPVGDEIGRCWDGRPRLSLTLSGLTWATTFFITDGSLDLMQSMAAHRIFTILLTALGILIVFFFSCELFGLKAGIFSSLALIFMPRFLAHSRYATLDMPVSIMMLATVYFFYKGMKSWKFGILSGIMFGLALSTKVNSYFIVPVIVLWLLISYRNRIIPVARDIKRRVFSIKRIPIAFYSMILFPLPVLILSWPWLWFDTIPRFFSYIGLYTVEGIGAAVYYMGSTFSFDGISAPWHYAWVMTGLTVPIFILIFAILGGFSALKDTITLKNRGSMLILLGVLAPLLMFTLPISSKISPYNGVRLFLWAFPFLAMLTGLGASKLYDFIKSKTSWKMVRWVALVIISILIIVPGSVSVLKGPTNSATYYNSLIGGAGNAFNSGFEVEYWGESYYDVALWLNENAENGSAIYPALAKNIFDAYKSGDMGEIVKRAGEGRHDLDSGLLERFNITQRGILREDIMVSKASEDSGYYIVMLSMKDIDASVEMKQYLAQCEPLYTVYSDGAPLASIYHTECVKNI